MKRKTVNSKGEVNLDLEPVAGKFAMAVRDGAAREIACFGTRSEKNVQCFDRDADAQLEAQGGRVSTTGRLAWCNRYPSITPDKDCRMIMHPVGAAPGRYTMATG